VSGVIRTKYFNCLIHTIRLINVIDCGRVRW
jgi:hypothetical protein